MIVVIVAEALEALSSQGLSVNQTVSVALINRRAADRGAGFPVAACPLAAGISWVHFPRQSCGLVELPVLNLAAWGSCFRVPSGEEEALLWI